MRTRKTAVVCFIAILFTMPVFAQEYGTGVTLTVPQVDPAAITIDGVADEAAWETAPEIDLTANWDGAWSGHPDADIEALGRVLYAEDTLYVTVTIQDYQQFYWGQPDNQWQGEQILIGIDPTHAGDDQLDPGYGGWPANAPDKGPYAYKVNLDGATLNWGYDNISPADSGWVNSAVMVDSVNFSWTVELAAYAPQIEQGAQIGFNIGGATASWDFAEENADSLGVPGEGTYAYFAWQVCPEPGAESTCQSPGGNVMSDAGSFATLNLTNTTVDIEQSPGAELPSEFELGQNYPNPFNPTTTIEFGLTRSAQVALEVFNTLGQKVATIADTALPAGNYSVQWQAGDLASGVYLYQLKVDGNIVASKKMLLAK